MAVTYGFYNALNHDRVYDAIQMSSIFDGIIRDGVFSTIGEALTCRASGSGLVVNVSSGRAWFNHTWTLNDTDYPVEAEEAEVVLDRIDAIVLEVNSAVEVRANTIKFIKGTPSQNPVRPTLIHNSEVNQYALAYVNIRAGQTTIFDSDITNVVGTDETPFITGLMQQVSIEELIRQWEDDFNRHFATWVAVNEAQYDLWTADMQAQYTAWMAGKVNEYQAWYAGMQAEGDADLAEFDAWFQHMKDQLDEDAAGHLQAEIDALALDAEKGSIVTVTTINTELYGRTVTISQNGQSRTAIFDNNGVAVFSSIPYVGVVEISSTDGTQTAIAELTIPYFGRYEQAIAFWAATVNITTTSPEFYSKQITVSRDNVVIGTTAFSALGRVAYTATSPGVYKFTVRYDGMDFDVSTNVTEETTYNLTLNAWTATFNIVSSLTTLYGRPISISKGGIVVGTTSFDATGHATYKVHETGTYLVSSSDAGGNTYEDTVVVTEETAYSVTLGTPQGSTALPTDSVPTWLACAGLTVGYTTLEEVLADETTLDILLRDSNACDYMARSTTWAKAEGLVPVMTSNTTPSGECFASDTHSPETYGAWKAFDKNDSTWWSSNYVVANSYIGYKFPSAVSVGMVMIHTYHENYATSVKLQGSNDGFTNDIHDIDTLTITTPDTDLYFTVSNSDNYLYYRLLTVTGNSGATNINYKEIQFYTDADITSDRDAMTRIGLYDYCSEKLLSNATWAEAIVESEYWEEILDVKIPTMTSNTTPEGECFGDLQAGYNLAYGDYYYPMSGSSYVSAGGTNFRLGYGFVSPTIINKVRIVMGGTSSGQQSGVTLKIQGSNDRSTWTDIDTFDTQDGNAGPYEHIFANDTAYRYYAIFWTGANWQGGYCNCSFLQFYGRHDSTVYQPLVPVMTSNTTPSGEVIGTGIAGFSDTNLYQIFTGDTSGTADRNVSDVGYKFAGGEKKVVKRYSFVNAYYASRGWYGIGTYKIQGLQDDDTWTDLTDTLNAEQNITVQYRDLDNDVAYKGYRLVIIDSSYPGGMSQSICSLQFYQAITATNKIHSCPNDTIYMMEDGSPVTLCTTDLNGEGSVDWSQFEPGTYTFYSSVAKDPSNLSNDYHKTVRITKGAFGHTTDLYLMPDNIIYWYGVERYPFSSLSIVMYSYGDRWSKGGTVTKNTNSVAYQLTNNTAPEGGFLATSQMMTGLLGKYVKAHYTVDKVSSNNSNFVGAFINSGSKNQNNYYYATLNARANENEAITLNQAYLGFGVDEPGNQNTDKVTLYSLFLQDSY